MNNTEISSPKLYDNIRRAKEFGRYIKNKRWLDFGCELGGMLDEICVSYVGKFETIVQDINKIKKILKMPVERFKLPHEKKGNYKHNYSNYYNAENKKLVEEIWGKVFKLFDYKYKIFE